MRSYKFYVSGSSASDNLANVLIAKSGRIKAIRWEVSIDQVGDNSVVVLELSMRPTNQLTTHDSTGDLSVIRSFGNLVTSGMFQGRATKEELVDVPVGASERIYFHCGTCTTTAYVATVYVDIAEGA